MSKMNIKVHESVDDPSISLYNKLKAALPGIEAAVEKTEPTRNW